MTDPSKAGAGQADMNKYVTAASKIFLTMVRDDNKLRRGVRN